MNRMPLSAIQSFENAAGKGISIWNWIQWWEVETDQYHDPSFNTVWMNEAREHGSIPMISWSPNAAVNGKYVNYDSILSGAWDQYFDDWGKASAQWGHPYFIRLMWEFTGSWEIKQGTYPWSNGNTPERFVEVWQYVVSHVRNAGGTQISWVWTPANVQDSVSSLQLLYPGDKYVDWVGTDVYPDKGQSFISSAELELSNIRAVSSKPVMIPEVGYPYDDSSFWNTLLTNELPSNPYIKAICIWEQPQAGFTVTDSTVSPTFKKAISSNYFSSNTFSNISNLIPMDQLENSTKVIPAYDPNQNPPAATYLATPLKNTENTNYTTASLVIVATPGILVALYLAIKFKRTTRK